MIYGSFSDKKLTLKWLFLWHEPVLIYKTMIFCRYPVTQGTSVLGVCFNGGVALAADTLGNLYNIQIV